MPNLYIAETSFDRVKLADGFSEKVANEYMNVNRICASDYAATSVKCSLIFYLLTHQIPRGPLGKTKRFDATFFRL